MSSVVVWLVEWLSGWSESEVEAEVNVDFAQFSIGPKREGPRCVVWRLRVGSTGLFPEPRMSSINFTHMWLGVIYPPFQFDESHMAEREKAPKGRSNMEFSVLIDPTSSTKHGNTTRTKTNGTYWRPHVPNYVQLLPHHV